MEQYWCNAGVVKLFFVAAALATVVQSQSEYEDCTTNYSVLEKAVLKTGNNLFKITTTFYPPDKDNPLYVSVTYKFLNTSDSELMVLNTTNYLWSSASLYLTIPPRVIRYLSLLFCYVEDDRIVDLELELPGECETQNPYSNSSNFLFVITHRVMLDCYFNNGVTECVRIIALKNGKQPIFQHLGVTHASQ